MLAIRDLVKTYPSGVHALKDVTLNVPAGMFGLLGPNSAHLVNARRTRRW